MSASLPFPVLALGISTHAQGLRLRRVRLRLAVGGASGVLPSPCLNKIGTRDFNFGARWLACVASRRCYTRDVTIASVRSEARVTGSSFLCKTLSFSIPIRFIPALSQAKILDKTPSSEDQDGHCISSGEEQYLGLSPLTPDSNNDGIPDSGEDSDGNGITNGIEAFPGLNHFHRNSDGDGVGDGYEDSDNDGIPNWYELRWQFDGDDPTD